MPTGDPGNAFEQGKPGTAARARAEAVIEGLRDRGGVFVDAVRATRAAMVLTDPNLPGNPIVFANQAFLDLSGYSLEEVLGQQPHFLNGADTDREDAGRFRRILEDDQDGVVETVQYAKDGRRFVATVMLSAFKDDAGRTLNHFLSWLDVTRRVDAEEDLASLREMQAALRESESKYRNLFNSIDEGFCVVEVLFDAQGRPGDYVFLEVNAPFARLTGLSDAVGKRMRELAPEHEQHWFDIYGRVALTGEPERFEQQAEALGRWYDVFAFRVGAAAQRRVAILFNDINERKRANLALRESEERQTFLLKLSDALRPLADAAQIQTTTARLLGAQLGADRAMYGEVEGQPGAELGTIRGQYVRPADERGPPPARFPDHFTFEVFGAEVMSRRYSGAGLIVADVDADPAFDAAERAAWAAAGVRAAIVAPLVKGGRLIAELGVHSAMPRAWTDAEVSLVREAAERTWAAAERARAEAALRESEERFRLIVETARDYGIFTADRSGRIDQWYEGAAQVFGWSADEAIGQPMDITFTPEDREDGVPQKERETAGREGHVPNVRWHVRKDGTRIFIDGICSALRDSTGALTGFLKIGQDVTERRRADERQKTLLAELQHRVRNILAMIRSVARRTSESAQAVEDYAQHLEGRIGAMARTQVLLTRSVGAAVDLQDLILDELETQAAQADQYTLTGPDVSLPPKAAEVLGLALHELATNAVKYGALSGEEGRIDVRWAILEGDEAPQLSIIWSELGLRIEAKPSRSGFGTELITRRVPYELRGTGTIEFTSTGLVATIEFPLVDAASILQTDEGT